MKQNVKSVVIVGVGGQGTLLTSRVLGAAMLNQGYDVKMSEVHGMSQRGGSVITYVRYGDKVYSPVIEQGEADVILLLNYRKRQGVCHGCKKAVLSLPIPNKLTLCLSLQAQLLILSI